MSLRGGMLSSTMTSSRRQIHSVKRNLFGTVDHQQIKEDLQKELARISEEKSKTWNFDFKNFKPLPPGRYKWERVGKRLQTRRSSTELRTTNTTESNSQLAMQEGHPKRRRYNLRTRNRDTENVRFRPIEPPARQLSQINGARPTVETGSRTGEFALYYLML